MAESNMVVSPETLDFLAEVKKGKPRRFVMITKGANIVSLVIYKKGSLEKHKKTAKEAGNGIVCFGVVDGSGQFITFKLSITDGFQDAPVKTTNLKNFLTEAGFACKPSFEIVEALPEVPADEVADTDALQASAQAAVAPSSTLKDASTPDPQMAKVVAAMNKLMPSVKLAIAKQPTQRDPLISSLTIAKQHLQNGEVDEARTIVISVGLKLKKLLTAAPASTSNDISAEWQSLRQLVVQDLKALAKIVAKTRDPDAAAAIIELKAVIANLSPNPTGAGLQDLQRYLSKDDVVADVCSFAFDFRPPMLDCLNRMGLGNAS